MSDLTEVITLFELFMEEGDDANLDRALALVNSKQVKLPEIMDSIQQFKADPRLKARTITAIRKHFGLSLIPGAVCQRKY